MQSVEAYRCRLPMRLYPGWTLRWFQLLKHVLASISKNTTHIVHKVQRHWRSCRLLIHEQMVISVKRYKNREWKANSELYRGVQKLLRLILCHWLVSSVATILQNLLLGRSSLLCIWAYSYRRISLVCLSVGLLICRNLEPCKNSLTDLGTQLWWCRLTCKPKY